MEQIPRDALAPKDAAKKYGLSWSALRMAIARKRVKPIRSGSRWYITEREMKRYIAVRQDEKIPKKYRRKGLR